MTSRGHRGAMSRAVRPALAALTAVTALVAVPATSGAIPIGPGTATVSPTVIVGTAATSLQFTYTATEALSSGIVTVTVPAGWTAPTTTNTSASTGTVSTLDSTITVSDVTLTEGEDVTVTFGVTGHLVTPPALSGVQDFTVAVGLSSDDTPITIASQPTAYLYALTPPTLLQELTSVPASVFNIVGTDSSVIVVSRPTALHKQPLFSTKVKGVVIPRIFLVAADFCPYCATASWSEIVALSRFGTFTKVSEMASSSTDIYSDTPGFTFYLSAYTSKFISFKAYVIADRNQDPLMRMPAVIQNFVTKYDVGPFPGEAGAIPFFDVGNQVVQIGSPSSPASLAGLTPDQIGAKLDVATSLTRSIVASANYLSASICSADHELPGSVCRSKGVLAADKALKLPQP